MIILILNTFLIFSRLLLYSWFTYDQVFFKVTICIVLIMLLFLLYKYPKPLQNNINIIADHYKIQNNYEKFVCFFVLSLYAILFVGGIFYVRLQHNDRYLDLSLLWNTLCYNIASHTTHIIILNFSLIVLIIILYLVLFIKLIKIFKRYWAKLHIYYAYDIDNNYNSLIWLNHGFFTTLDYKGLAASLEDNCPSIFSNKQKLPRYILGFQLRYHVTIFIKKMHYILLLAIILYDIVFNHYVIHYIYTIIPYIFLYDLYIRACDLYYEVDHLYSADTTAHRFLYAETIHILDKTFIYLDNDLYEIEYLTKVVFVYLNDGLNAGKLCKLIDGEDYYNYYYSQFNYYKDWNTNSMWHKDAKPNFKKNQKKDLKNTHVNDDAIIEDFK